MDGARFVIVVGVMSVASSSRAAEPTFHTMVEIGTTYSDNILAVPDEPPNVQPPVGPPATDLIIRVAPGAAIRCGTATSLWQARYTRAFIFYAVHPAVDTSADLLHGDATLTPTQDDDVGLVFDLGRYSTNVSTLSAPQETQIVAQRGSDSTIVAISAAEDWARTLSPDWKWLQNATAAIGVPVEGGASLFTATLRTGPRVAFVDHAFGLQPEVTYAAPITDDATRDAGFQADQQILVGGQASWHWAFGPPDWSLALRAGATAALDGADTTVEPVGGAGMRFQRTGYGVTASYDRGYTPNIITGQTYFTNSWVLRGEIPISTEAHVRASTGSGFSFNRAVDLPRAVEASGVKAIIADAAVGWYPDLYPHVEVRYQYTQQWDAPPDQLVLPNFDRNVLSVSVSYMWPPVELTLPKGHRRTPDDPVDPMAPLR